MLGALSPTFAPGSAWAFHRARAQGKRLGRRPVSTDVVERIREQLATGAGILKTAKALGVGTGTVHRVKREMASVAA
jgi:DNA invertase Pin-like site-specific DNA recombinase